MRSSEEDDGGDDEGVVEERKTESGAGGEEKGEEEEAGDEGAVKELKEAVSSWVKVSTGETPLESRPPNANSLSGSNASGASGLNTSHAANASALTQVGQRAAVLIAKQAC
eukprot:582465-Rhodomonas_salina.1